MDQFQETNFEETNYDYQQTGLDQAFQGQYQGQADFRKSTFIVPNYILCCFFMN